jgi:uncharacterized protein YkwD
MRTHSLAAAVVATALMMPAAQAVARTDPGHSASDPRVARAATGSDRAAHAKMRPLRWERRVIALTNARRKAHGVKPLKASRCVHHFAGPWARHMARTQSMVHHSDLSPLFDCVQSPRAAGENIAAGFTTPRSVVRAWMSDKGHRDNILNPAFRRIGVAGARVGQGPIYSIQDFVG